jgi:hypothetical protein
MIPLTFQGVPMVWYKTDPLSAMPRYYITKFLYYSNKSLTELCWNCATWVESDQKIKPARHIQTETGADYPTQHRRLGMYFK